tara:strand:+ start:3144 stop:3317 length:174 start_codon:yes stop_codon:yes gene_type:complete
MKNAPFKLRSGNKPNKKGFFGTVKDRFIKKGKNILNIKSKKDILKAIGYSDKDIKGN